MQIGIIAPGRDVSEWSRALRQSSGIEVQVWPHMKEPQKVELAIAWNPPLGILAEFRNLKLISSLGAGVDHIIRDNGLPDVPVVRIVDEMLSQDMSNYILMAVLNHQRKTFFHYENQKKRTWDHIKSLNKAFHIGILGLGVLGKAVSQSLVACGFNVLGYSKSQKRIKGVQCFYGDLGFSTLMAQIDVLVNLLPLTAETRNILGMPTFKMARKPIFLINVARGGHLVEADLLQALDQGLVSGACLDVFNEEPLPAHSPLWEHKNIIITPHIASVTNPNVVVAQILDNFDRVKRGITLNNQIDRNKGY